MGGLPVGKNESQLVTGGIRWRTGKKDSLNDGEDSLLVQSLQTPYFLLTTLSNQ